MLVETPRYRKGFVPERGGRFVSLASLPCAPMLTADTRRALVAGGVAGVTESLVTMPFEVTKNRLQLGHGPKGIAQNMADTYARQGAAGLYYGLQAQLVQVSGKAAVRFAAFENIKRVLPAGYSFTAGTLAGLTEALILVAPTERLKVLRTAELSGAAGAGGSASVWRAATIVVKQQGISGLWFGSGPTAARQAIANGARFGVYEHFKAWLSAIGAPAPAVLAGGMSGVFSVALTNPVDVIKTRVQATPLAAAGAAAAEGGTNGAAAGHTLAVVRGMLAHEGVGVFTTGMVARAWKIGLGQAVIFGTYDAVRRRL